MKPNNQTVWHIIGNGKGPLHTTAKQRTVCFNQPSNTIPEVDLVISNKFKSGTTKSFELKGIKPYEGFTEALSHIALTLEQQLNAWPSLGLATIVALQNTHTQLSLSRMNLLPSIARPASLADRKPLPCNYHNWLGERRLALSILDKLDWPSFWLSKTSDFPPVTKDPYPALIALPSYSSKEGLKLIQQLDSLTESSWYCYATDEHLKKVETLFLLQRDRQKTTNWWLYDYEASLLMANIHRHLALAQQLLHLSSSS